MPTCSFRLLLAAALFAGWGGGSLGAQTAPPPPPAEDTAEVLAWPSPPAAPRIKWVAEYRNAFDVGAKKKRTFLDRLAGKAEEVIWLERPLSVAVDEQGLIFVGDFTRGIIVMDPVNKAIRAFSAVNGAVLPTPTGLAVDSKLVFATSSNLNQVLVFDKKGRQLSALSKADGINRPVGIAVDEARDLVVLVNSQEHAVRLYTRTLQLIKVVGERGSEDGQFNMPSYACIIPGVGFAVADTGNFRIQIFDFEGKFIRAFGKVGNMPGDFARPKGIGVDPDGHLYVADGIFNNFQIFDQEGHLLLFVGQVGVRRGQFQVPTGLATDTKGGVFVVDQINARIQKFQYLPEEKTAPPVPAKQP
ncbi:hypothetical protein [Geothrix edaphica]|uniref:6-bladed beta-propeller n=1 Tax=Geothrix edaphica TaxID=2927976 RepID=A0ABQ5PZD2_9BACT|nr:hypothetical protein [Geothrix edaphica]GLH67825.1 hypothetical protein GETHED_21890 [Geothrix edaphica]